ncbi:alkylated DNA repair protein alkB homolog 8 isoform X1 [Vanessa atalanta]|uniref:alkylated DNA repair protein alkB homolog 8 isoform X1 n=2 Tax=Vanessa atalanta TaxID=42275 RepID=UPI001FCD19BA|nr:alkylated DNA repair protein alkB homolog 8 isoform X1 [Vanessa atalanta]
MDEAKKTERKRKRFAARLKISKGIICSEGSEPNIVLCNVGQATGFEKQDVVKMLNILPSVKLKNFIAEKGESHCFIVFHSSENAKLFYDAYNGKERAGNVPIYMNYVKNVPNSEVVCTSNNPEGLHLLTDFISETEERAFLQLFDWIDESNLKNRQVKHFGYEFRYGSNDVDLSSPLSENIPEECNILWERLSSYGIEFRIPDQLTVNKYSPGQGIPSHVDRHSPFDDTILSLSLGSSVVMDWKHHTGKYFPLVVPARSLLVMQGEARYDWQHGIQPRTWDPVIEIRNSIASEQVRVLTNDTVMRQMRISLTCRKTRQGKCECGYKMLCDNNKSDIIEDEVASKLEELHVHQVYEQIAGHFSSTRHKPWPKVVEFLKNTPPGSIVLDLGAGNGKNVLKRNDILQIAGERSSGLLDECRRQSRGVAGADCVRLDLLGAGLRARIADVVICVAVIHHFSNQARRLQAVSTITNLLRPGGRALITVWAKDQTKSNYLCKDKENLDASVHSTVGGLNLPIHENRTQFKHNDLLVPWKLRNVKEKKIENESSTTLLRYYHVFEEGELDKLCDLPDLVVEKSFYEEGNWCVICKKV